jgi:hypothetical protein
MTRFNFILYRFGAELSLLPLDHKALEWIAQLVGDQYIGFWSHSVSARDVRAARDAGFRIGEIR